MPYTTPNTSHLSGDNIGATELNQMFANFPYLLGGKLLRSTIALYSNVTLATAATATSPGTALFTQVDNGTGGVAGASAHNSFVTQSGRVAGLYTFPFSNLSAPANQTATVWFTVGLLLGAYNGSLVTYDTGSVGSPLTAGQGSYTLNNSAINASGFVTVPFVFTGLVANTTYSVALYWRNWEINTPSAGTVTSAVTGWIRSVLWEV